MTQEQLCLQYNLPFVEANGMSIIGIQKEFDMTNLPINGLRHPLEANMTGWYLWSGETFPTENTDWVAIHASHISELYPEINKFLGLPPGWRFLKAGEYEDVWSDETLYDIEPLNPDDETFYHFKKNKNFYLNKD